MSGDDETKRINGAGVYMCGDEGECASFDATTYIIKQPQPECDDDYPTKASRLFDPRKAMRDAHRRRKRR